MSAPIVGDDAIAVSSEEEHLGLPRIRIQRPAVGEGHDRSCAPILEIDLRAVRYPDLAHPVSPLRGRDGLGGQMAFGMVKIIGLTTATLFRFHEQLEVHGPARCDAAVCSG